MACEVPVLVFSGDSVTLSGNHLPVHDSSGALHLTQLQAVKQNLVIKQATSANH